MSLKQISQFALLHFLFWSIISLAYFKVTGFYTDPLGICFTVAFILGHIFLFALLFWLLNLFSLLIKKNWMSWLQVAIGGICSTFFCVDILVYSQYRFHISMAMLQLFFGPAGREIFVFPVSTYVMTLGILVLIFGLSWGFYKIAKKVDFSKKIMWTILGLLVFCLLGYNILYAWGKFMMIPSIIAQRSVLPFANPLSANRKLRKMGFEPKAEPMVVVKKNNLNYPLNSMDCHPTSKKNILIILVDSLRYDSLDVKSMPFLTSRMNQKGYFNFTKHISGGNATEAGVFSLFYSLPYAYWNAFTSKRLPPVFITELQKNGYAMGIYSSGKLNSPTFHQNVFASIPNLRIDSKGNEKWERDMDAVEGFEDFLKNQNLENPFFGFIFLDSPHGMEYPKEDEVFEGAASSVMNYLVLTKNTDPTPYMARYKNSLHFTDRMIERIFKDLEAKNLLKDTIIMVSGDHGQEINDTHNNFWGHNGNFSKYQTQVPLIVWYPEKLGGTINYVTQHYDIVPTLLQDVLSCTNKIEDYSIGKNLFNSTPRAFSLISSYNKTAIQTDDKLTVLDAYGMAEYYDENYKKLTQGANEVQVMQALKELSKYYK